MKKQITAFKRNERGATMIEYALVVGLIAIVVVGGVTLFGDAVNDLFGDIARQPAVTTAPAPQTPN